ncbi:MAG TPA: ABC transporter permease [Tepidisphaeraceae bacterium]|jgi:peptide/nickel transport system permease protein|nr:ABC transporter permease [Tepidisphaeraceae bacterium]
MLAYIIRRTLWTIPIVLGVVLLTFTLFTLVAKDPARMYAGRRATPEVLESIRHKMGLDKPIWINVQAAHESGFKGLFDSQFFDILFFRFAKSMRYDEGVGTLFWRKAPVSFAIQLPVFIIELGCQLVLALLVASYRGRWPDYVTTFVAVLGMSVPPLSIYLGAQWLLAAHWKIFPVAGWDVGFYAVQFAALPILVSVVGGIGGGTRFYRTVVLEEINADYVRTARSKGVASREVLFTHVLRNVMIPVLTNTVTALPLLLLGAVILERLFQIPGVGNLLVDSVFNNDRPVIMATTYMLSIAYCLALLLTDICYTLVDPRVTLG